MKFLNNIVFKIDEEYFLFNLLSFRRNKLPSNLNRYFLASLESFSDERGYYQFEDTLLDWLKKNKHILDEDEITVIDDYNAQKFKENYLKAPDIIEVTLLLGYDCNHVCSYCYQHGQNYMLDKITAPDIDRIEAFYIDYFHELYSSDPDFSRINFIITGGEPLLPNNMESIFKLIEKFPQSHFVIQTNGVLIPEFLKLNPPNDHVTFKISIDGNEKNHNRNRKLKQNTNSYSQVIKGIQAAMLHKYAIYLKITADKTSLLELSSLFDDLEEFGVLAYPKIEIGITGIMDIGRTFDLIGDLNELQAMESFFKLTQSDRRIRKIGKNFNYGFRVLVSNFNRKKGDFPYFKKSNCSVVQNDSFCFFPNGDVRICASCSNDEFSIGNYKEDFYIDYLKIIELKSRFVLNHSKCNKCDFRYVCGGGCFLAESSSGVCKRFLDVNLVSEALKYEYLLNSQ